MAATTKIYELTSASAGVDKTSGTANMRFKHNSDTTVDNVDPMVKPSSNYDRSYHKNISLYVTAAPAVSISNLSFWFSASGDSATAYTQGDTTQSMYYVAGTYAASASAPTDDSGYTKADATHASPSNKLSLTGSIGATTGVGTFQVVKAYLRIGTTVTAPGLLTIAQSNISYDEI